MTISTLAPQTIEIPTWVVVLWTLGPTACAGLFLLASAFIVGVVGFVWDEIDAARDRWRRRR